MNCELQHDEGLRTDHPDSLKLQNANDLNELRASIDETTTFCSPGNFKKVMFENGKSIEFLVTDIADITCDAVVNAANETLEGGGGVDHAIHTAAGPGLLAECLLQPLRIVAEEGGAIPVGELCRCPVGEAVITSSHEIAMRSKLHAKYIIHTVAPLLDEAGEPREAMLRTCYRNCILLAEERGINSLGFCSLGTGFYGFPQVLAAKIAISECTTCLKSSFNVKRVVFAIYGRQSEEIYQLCFKELALSCTLHFPHVRRKTAIDIGSGSSKIQIADVRTSDGSLLHELYSDERPCAFGIDWKTSVDGKLSSEIQEKGIGILREYINISERHGAVVIHAVATEVFRKCGNGPAYLERVRQLGINVQLVTQELEAELGFRSVISAHGCSESEAVVWDSGGASFQITSTSGESQGLRIYKGSLGTSVALATLIEEVRGLTMTRELSGINPITSKEISKLIEYLTNKLEAIPDWLLKG